jgi:peroxiredoxin Q/BCP
MKNIIFILSMFVAAALPGISDALEVGDKAPGFEGVSTHGNVILSEFEGNKHVVLALYYADFTPV